MIDIREPRKIRQYGEGDAFEPTPPPRAYEPPPEVKARYKKYKILTLTAFALLFVLLTEGVMFLTFRVLVQQSVLTQILPMFIEVFLLVALYAIYRYEQNTNDMFTLLNLSIIIIGETVLSVGMLLVYYFEISWLVNIIALVSIVFALYVLIFVKVGLKFRLVMCAVIASAFFVADVVALHTLEFTPRYLYVSTGGYQGKVNDENNYYYENDAEVFTIENDDFINLREYSNMVSSVGWCAKRVNEIGQGNSIEFLNSRFMNKFRYGDLINAEGRYDDAFFEKNSLFFSFVDLENPNDTIELTDVEYAKLFSRPHITYKRSKSSEGTETATGEKARALCIVILEVSKAEERNVIKSMVDFAAYHDDITYR